MWLGIPFAVAVGRGGGGGVIVVVIAVGATNLCGGKTDAHDGEERETVKGVDGSRERLGFGYEGGG